MGPDEGPDGRRARRVDLDDYLRRCAQASRAATIRADAEPEKGFYYRSDHFNFAKKGVPALYADSGVDFIGKPAGTASRSATNTRPRLSRAVGRD